MTNIQQSQENNEIEDKDSNFDAENEQFEEEYLENNENSDGESSGESDESTTTFIRRIHNKENIHSDDSTEEEMNSQSLKSKAPVQSTSTKEVSVSAVTPMQKRNSKDNDFSDVLKTANTYFQNKQQNTPVANANSVNIQFTNIGFLKMVDDLLEPLPDLSKIKSQKKILDYLYEVVEKQHDK